MTRETERRPDRVCVCVGGLAAGGANRMARAARLAQYLSRYDVTSPAADAASVHQPP